MSHDEDADIAFWALLALFGLSLFGAATIVVAQVVGL